MAVSAIADASFLVALLRKRDTHRAWAAEEASRHPPPWHTCEAALSEAFHMLDGNANAELGELFTLDAISIDFALADHREAVIALMQKYSQLPMSLADACLVRMTEILSDPLILTTDSDFRLYRRHGRQVIPVEMPR
jgi:predicted nucleic acid-binding protein